MQDCKNIVYLRLFFCFEEYLNVLNPKHRIVMSKFRCSSHKLMIEQGRHLNIDRENRICQNCNMNIIEDEYHFYSLVPPIGTYVYNI